MTSFFRGELSSEPACWPLQNLEVFPTTEELLGEECHVDKNIPIGVFPSAEEYLKIQFRLLREDFVAPLRKAMLAYRSEEPQDYMFVHKNVVIQGCTFDFTKRNRRLFSRRYTYSVIVRLFLKPNEKLQDCKRFMAGSLLIFSNDNFRNLVFATVIKPPHRLINGNLVEIAINFPNKGEDDLDLSCLDFDGDGGYLIYEAMAECRSYFAPYFHVLTALQSINSNDFPLERYIIRAEKIPNFPKYLTEEGIMKIDDCEFDVREDWPKTFYGFNESQMSAFKAALTQEFTLIQGPPGTGKTYLGLQIAKSLLDNSHLWYEGSPLLVISQKNHIVDQFLEGLIPFTERIVRIGNQSESEKLQKFNRQWFESSVENALVVGMTTYCAAATIQSFMHIEFPIVIVDEAAEILETHVITALARNCQQLIMLGDHKQLQPMISDYKLKTEYHFGISLFERMVNNGVQCHPLDVQYRMSSEIASLLRLRIYPFLKDHESVKSNPSVNGVEGSLFFLDHNEPEEPVGMTKKNKHEAQFLVEFALYLSLNCHKAEEITILASYSGQVQEIEAELKQKHLSLIKDVRVTTLDGFQGEESDIILLSLVRNNEDENLGFLSDENRICVALSRARYGLYIMENKELLLSSDTWRPIMTYLNDQRAIGNSLTLQCSKHKARTEVRTSKDFKKVPHGGCDRKCDFNLKCGHKCNYFCHGFDEHHEEYQCKEKCEEFSCDAHKCERFCFEKGRPCVFQIKKVFECGHVVETECHKEECPTCEEEA